MPKKRKPIPPSRGRYDKDNPVVSCRVSAKVRDRLQAIKRLEGRTMADILEAGLGLHEVKARDEREIKEESHEKGVEEGYDLAISIYQVTYPCSVCRKPIDVESDGEKKAIRQFMIDNGWGHGGCITPSG